MTFPKHLRSINWLKHDWIGNDRIEKSGAQAHVLENLKPGQFPILSYGKHHGRLWTAVTSEELLKLLSKNRGIYEILVPDIPRKVYFDVDKCTLTLDEIKNIVLNYFPNAEFNISGRLSPELSLHIVVGNYHCDNLKDSEVLKIIALKHRDQGFDPSVYEKNKNFKCINQSKPREPVQAHIEGSKNLADHLILHAINFEQSKNINTLTFDLPEVADSEEKKKSSFERELQIDLLAIPQQDLPVPEHFDSMTALPIDWLAMLPNPAKYSSGWLHHNIIWQVMCWCKQSGISYDQFWQWNRQKNNTVERYQRYSKLWNECKYPVSQSLIRTLLERTFPKINETRVTQILRQQFDVPDVRVVKDAFLNEGHISKSTKFSVLASPMGTAKTESVVQYLISNAKDLKVLWIAPRITLAQNTLQRLSDAGLQFVNYKDISPKEKAAGALDNQTLLICSIQSIHYLKSNFDVIVADEWDTIASTFSKDCRTHGENLQNNWNIWLSQIQKAKKVLFMDAFSTKLTMNFLEHLRQYQQPKAKENALGFPTLKRTRTKTKQLPYEFITTEREQDPRTFKEALRFADWMWNILTSLTARKKIYVFTPFRSGKKGVEHISKAIMKHMKWTEGEDILCYYADKEAEKRRLSDVETVWSDPKVKCIVTNGAISVGVNFNQPNIFHSIHAYYSPQIPVRDFFQALYRVRKPISSEMFLYRDKVSFFGYTMDDRKFPSCSVFHQLRQDLHIEELANKNVRNWETFNLFAEKANVSIHPQQLEEIERKNVDFIWGLLKDVNCIFDWDKIPSIPPEVPVEFIDALEGRVYSNSATIDDRLMYQKYLFSTHFRHDADETVLMELWEKNIGLPRKVEDFLSRKTPAANLMNDLFLENNVELGAELPTCMETSIPLEKIQRAFQFHNPPQNYRTSLCARMINSYFMRNVYNISIQVMKDKKHTWPYELDEEFQGQLQGYLDNRRNYISKQNCIDLLADDSEDDVE